MPDTEYVIVGREDTVAVLTLNRPEALNALSPAMLAALCDALESLDADEAVRAIIIDGGQRAFAAGADIQAMAQSTPMDIVRTGTLSYWQRIRRVNKPLIAAVELAMLCDLIVASETARFAQPEIKLGIMPGAGGTQRLARAIGFYRAMEMILTGEPISARQAYEAGLVNRVVPPERYLDEALELARLIASRPPVAVRLAREALRYGYESTLRDGLEIERRNFTLLFDTQDQKEGMRAFLEKRSPDFSGR